MNILPHKSWHVRTKKNIEKVRRDERKAQEEAEAVERRRALAGSEARINFLRSKTHTFGDGNQQQVDVVNSDNLSSVLEERALDAAAEDKLKYEREQAAKKEQENWEKKVGILTYLGQGLTEPEVETPWYLKTHEKRLKLKPEVVEPSCSFQHAGHVKNDPLDDMRMYMDMMKSKRVKSSAKTSESDHRSREKRRKLSKSSSFTESRHEEESRSKKVKKSSHKKHKKHHRHKSSKKKRKRSSSESDPTELPVEEAHNEVNEVIDSRETSIEKLRLERLKREKIEHDRIKRMFAKPHPEQRVETNERKLNYNSQFNPHLARER
ncbi:leukocyte receptor cluster member 1 homolog [Brevipalpus obovatus]|uniref:leukocyte receptor cluster member 1 homolog n=1 Tax=Brevipalpus obovatus TaxID=246614 RepID=UPI003D9F97A3